MNARRPGLDVTALGGVCVEQPGPPASVSRPAGRASPPDAIVYRSIRPDDAAGLQAFHRRLSDDTVRNRFFGVHRELSDQEAQRFTSLTAGEETAVVGTVSGQIIAVGRSIRVGDGNAAEVAFVVEDGYQHHGIGTTLLALLARFAWADGVRHFVADTFASNRLMLDVFMHSPQSVTVLSTRRDASVIHLVMLLTAPPGLHVRGPDALAPRTTGVTASVRVSAEDAVRLIKSGDSVFVHGGSAVPGALLGALLARGSEIHDVELVHLHMNGPVALASGAAAPNIRHRALFVDASTRDAVATGAATYVPVFLSDVPRLFSSGRLPLDVALLNVSPPDIHGFCSLGVSVDCSLAAARAARLRIAQLNPRMPRTHGDSFIHVDDIDAFVEVEEELPEAPSPVVTDRHTAVGRLVAELVEDGATLQLGIGAIPNAVLAQLTDRRDLGIHSEVVSDGILELVRRGVITGGRKTVNRGKIVVAFLNGSRRLYDFADDNPMLEMRGVDYTNDTRVILRLDNMVAINSALEIDLTGQVCAESVGSHMYSGVGGQMDFLRGAALSQGGQPVIAMLSTARGGQTSRIVPTLAPGAGVTTTRAHVHWVVTEHGRVNLHGLDLTERARSLIGLAAPAFREDLAAHARRLGLV